MIVKYVHNNELNRSWLPIHIVNACNNQCGTQARYSKIRHVLPPKVHISMCMIVCIDINNVYTCIHINEYRERERDVFYTLYYVTDCLTTVERLMKWHTA